MAFLKLAVVIVLCEKIEEITVEFDTVHTLVDIKFDVALSDIEHEADFSYVDCGYNIELEVHVNIKESCFFIEEINT